MNRGNAKAQVYHSAEDYDAFMYLIMRACRRIPMRVPGFCLMPNHFHLILWPHADGDLSRWMQWLLTSHVRRYHKIRGTSGRVWQGRFKAFPIQHDGHYLTVLRYVERNPLRAGLVADARDWRWSSLNPLSRPRHDGPAARPTGWVERVNDAETPAELESVRRCAYREAPFGESEWIERTAAQLGLQSCLRSRGRPRRN